MADGETGIRQLFKILINLRIVNNKEFIFFNLTLQIKLGLLRMSYVAKYKNQIT